MTILETKNLKKYFEGVKAVDDLSLVIERGKIAGIVGPNGSGKTTLINVLTGVLPIDSGLVVVGENKLVKIEPHLVPQYGLARTFQNIRLFEQMSVLDNILVVLTERRVFSSLFEKHGRRHLEQAEEVLQKVGLWEKRNQSAINLSYGQRKLLEIARMLAVVKIIKSDAIIFLDEPFAGLVPQMVKKVMVVLRELKSQGKTVVLIEHDMDLIRSLTDYLFVMDSGRLLVEGKPADVLKRKEVIAAYLGE
jgi:branched-chain amino acid transport system ATP-binding protein